MTLDFAETADGQKKLREADSVWAVDGSKDFCEPLPVTDRPASGRCEGSGPSLVKQEEIAVDSTQPNDIQRAIAAVKRAHRLEPK